MENDEVFDALDSYKEEAMKIAINAFNEGFLLGVKHANKALKDLSEDIEKINK